ncbi:MAG: IS701 family transposase [Planctomycetes bacterium]|nr:IS701 family transposase [Planctomycetota bacterium]
MDRRFEVRKQEMLAECEVSPEVFRGVEERMKKFLQPFADLLRLSAQREHASDYVSGLVSDLERKNIESIAYRHDQGRRNLQHFIGGAQWDPQPLFTELAGQVGREIGESDGVIVFDPSAFAKKGKQSVGVARQWSGRLGKVDNCQVAVYMGYVSRLDHVLVNTRLYLPEEWTRDRKRMKAAGVPKGVRFQTRHAQALEMLDEQGDLLPHGWVAGDDEMGRTTAFRRDLNDRNEHYLLAVPSNTAIRDLEATPPPYGGHGSAPKTPFVQAHQWRDDVDADGWTRIKVRDAEKGPIEIEIVACRVQTKIKRRMMQYDEMLVIIRCLDEDGATKYDYYLSNAPSNTPLKEFARVAVAAHCIEAAIKRGKSEAGLSDYEVRNWRGWHHHQILALIATWFLVSEAHRGKKIHTRHNRSADPRWNCDVVTGRLPMRHRRENCQEQNPPIGAKRRGEVLSLQST